MNDGQLMDLLGPRYRWAYGTEPVKRLVAFIGQLESRIGELEARAQSAEKHIAYIHGCVETCGKYIP